VPIVNLIRDVVAEVGQAAAQRLIADGAEMPLDDLLSIAVAQSDWGAGQGLSQREREVAHWVARGLTNGEIAEALSISHRTVESHVDHIRQKLGKATRHQIVAWALSEFPQIADERP